MYRKLYKNILFSFFETWLKGRNTLKYLKQLDDTQWWSIEKLPYVQGHGNISLGDNVYLSGKSGFTVGDRHYEDPDIIIGNNAFISHDCEFSANLKMQIGNNCT